MSRKLASIQKIIDIQPIPGADAIEVATVLGWHCVIAKKDNFKINGLVCYFEVDSLLPLRPEFEFLGKGNKPKKIYVNGKEVQGYRLKTIRLRGQISQGLIMPLSILPHSLYPEGVAGLEGIDVTEQLEVYKYEIPLPVELAGKARGGFPGFIPKTDEVRLQAYPQFLERYKDIPFWISEKVDGTSCTFAIKNNEFHVAGRTIDWLDDGKNTYWQVAKELEIEKKMRENGLAEKIALQGEMVGPNIQKNTLRLSKPTILFFNAYNFEEHRFLSYEEFIMLFQHIGLSTVPIVNVPGFKLLPTVDEMVAFATRKSIKNPDVWLEGVVWRPLKEMRDEDIGRLSFKVINPQYLLKYDS